MNARSPFPLPSAETGFRPNIHHAGAVAIKRTIAAARKAGLDVAGFEALPDGTIRVFDARLAPKPAEDLFEQYDREGKL